MTQTPLNLAGDGQGRDLVATLAKAEQQLLQSLAERVAHGAVLKPSELRTYEKLLGKVEGRQIATNTEELAAAVGKTKRTVLRWLKDGAPANADGTYDIDAVLAWREEKDGKAVEPGNNGTQRGTDWHLEYKKQQAELHRLKKERMEGELIPRKQVLREFVLRIQAVKEGLLNQARSVAPILEGMDRYEIESKLDEENRALLEQFSRPLPKALTKGGANEHGETEQQGAGLPDER